MSYSREKKGVASKNEREELWPALEPLNMACGDAGQVRGVESGGVRLRVLAVSCS